MASKWPVMMPNHIPNVAEQFQKTNFRKKSTTCHHILSYDIIWHHMISCDIIWYHHDIIWHRMVSYDIIWHHMTSYDVIWCHMMSYDTIRCQMISWWYHMMSHDIIWCHMMSYDKIWWHVVDFFRKFVFWNCSATLGMWLGIMTGHFEAIKKLKKIENFTFF